MAGDGVVTVGTQVDVGALRTGMADAEAAVQSAFNQMAAAAVQAKAQTDAYNQAIKAVATGAITEAAGIKVVSEHLQAQQAAAQSLSIAKRNLADAQSYVAALAETESAQIEKLTEVIEADAAAANEDAEAQDRLAVSARTAATSGIGLLEGRMMSGNRAASAFLTTTLGLGPILEAAFPIIGAVALADVLIRIGSGMIDVIDETFRFKTQLQDLDHAAKDAADSITKMEIHTEELQKQAAVKANPVAGYQEELDTANQNLTALQANAAKAKKSLEDLQQIQTNLGPYQSSQLNINVTAARQNSDVANARVDEAVAEQQKAQAEFSHAVEEQNKRNEEAARKAANASREATSRLLSAENEDFRQSDEQAKKELETYKKLDELKTKSAESTRSLKPDETYSSKPLDDMVEKQIELWTAQTRSYEATQKNSDALAEASIQFQEATGAITRQQAAFALAALHAAEYTRQIQALKDLQAEQTKSGNTAGAIDTGTAISTTQNEQAIKRLQDNANASKTFLQPFQSAFNQIDQQFNSSIDGWLRGTERFSVAFTRMADNMAITFVNSLLRQGEQWVAHEAMKLAIHAATNEGIMTQDQAAAATSQATSAQSTLTQITHYAALAAAKAYSALADIPVVGPALGAVAAGATFVAVEALAAFDQGTGLVPRDGIAMLHKDESVLPPPQTAALKEALSGRGRGNGSGNNGAQFRDFNLTYHGGQSGSPADMMTQARRHARLMNWTQST